ncbi:MAG: phosphoribosyltransferase [Promethearchaeota archaeon]|nr:MAG: phosphoribosyltransferase [Candidatus Lokiarchaeota archaeon]
MGFSRYNSRKEAGKILSNLLESQDKELYKKTINHPDDCFSFAIPNGGIPVAEGFCSELKIKYDILIVRKIKIPYNPEAGFGSVTTDGTILLNQDLLSHLNLNEKEIKKSIEKTKQEIQDRLQFYGKGRKRAEKYINVVQGKNIFMIDDGLASGFTMLAAIKMVKKYNPKSVYLAVPTAPRRTVEKIKSDVDKIFCPNVKEVLRFAVADAYKHWYDVPKGKIFELLSRSEYYYDI